jgi:hypothetical protein
MTMARTDLRSWAALLPLSAVHEFAEAVSDAVDLTAQWALLVEDNELQNPGESAATIYGGAARRVSARLNRFAPGISPDRELPPVEILTRLLDSLSRVRAAAGLPTPALRPPRKPERFWEEPAGDGVGFKYLAEVPGRTDRTRFGGVDTRWATKWAVDLGGWKFEVSDSGELTRATRK